MGSDLDYSHPEVEADVLAWGKWLADTVPLRGIRFDAIKHYSEDFLRKFIVQMDEKYGEGWFFVGEFWKDSLDDMTAYLSRMGKKFSLFDAPLVYNFSAISKAPDADLRKVFDHTLVQVEPVNAVVCYLYLSFLASSPGIDSFV
jgi:alpha-amylase